MRTRTMFIIISLMVFAVALASGAERKFDKKFNVAAGGTLTLNTDQGTVRIAGSGSNEVAVAVVMEGREKDVNDFDIQAEPTAGGVEIRGKSRRSSWFWNSSNMNVTFTISVPQNYNLMLHTSGGNIEIKAVNGSMRGGTSGGNIELSNTEGQVDLETSGGNVRAEKTTGKLHMETSGGDIRLASVTGDVDVSTSGGNISIERVDGMVKAETSGGNISLDVKNGNKGIYAETSGGSIVISVDKNIGATIDASTSGGDVQCDLPVTVSGKISESHIRGTVNGGGPTIRAHTSGGDVHIRAGQ